MSKISDVGLVDEAPPRDSGFGTVTDRLPRISDVGLVEAAPGTRPEPARRARPRSSSGRRVGSRRQREFYPGPEESAAGEARRTSSERRPSQDRGDSGGWRGALERAGVPVCRSCHTRNNPRARSCARCGHALSSSASVVIQAPPSRRERARAGLVLSSALCAVAGLLAAGFFFASVLF